MAKIHPNALVESEDIGEGTAIWAFAHVMKGVHIGCHVNIGDHAFLETGAVVHNNVTIKNQVCIWEGITIEDDVFVGPRVTFTNDQYPRSPRMSEVKARYASRDGWLCRTVVRRGCAIGAAATICPGLQLGAYSVIGAGAVVTKDVFPFALMLGVPARKVGDVCSCGKPLSGSYEQSTCNDCGETGQQRVARLHALEQTRDSTPRAV
jgi:UDP-2-acetamido-3-amino-2,3-dideoxy-glucuronate N-acetyltransferase